MGKLLVFPLTLDNFMVPRQEFYIIWFLGETLTREGQIPELFSAVLRFVLEEHENWQQDHVTEIIPLL